MECVQVRRSLDTFVSGFGDADTSSEIPWISRKDKKEGRSLHEKGIFQILVYLIQVIYAVELSLFWRFICEIYNSLNSLLRPHSSVTCPSSSRDRPPYISSLHLSPQFSLAFVSLGLNMDTLGSRVTIRSDPNPFHQTALQSALLPLARVSLATN